MLEAVADGLRVAGRPGPGETSQGARPREGVVGPAPLAVDRGEGRFRGAGIPAARFDREALEREDAGIATGVPRPFDRAPPPLERVGVDAPGRPAEGDARGLGRDHRGGLHLLEGALSVAGSPELEGGLEAKRRGELRVARGGGDVGRHPRGGGAVAVGALEITQVRADDGIGRVALGEGPEPGPGPGAIPSGLGA